MARKTEQTKESRTKTEKRRLNKLFEEAPESIKKIVAGDIDDAAFLRVELEDMRKDLDLNGWDEDFCQGNQAPYKRARPLSSIYLNAVAKQTKILDKLVCYSEKYRKVEEKNESDGFDEFVSGRDMA